MYYVICIFQASTVHGKVELIREWMNERNSRKVCFQQKKENLPLLYCMHAVNASKQVSDAVGEQKVSEIWRSHFSLSFGDQNNDLGDHINNMPGDIYITFPGSELW